MPATRANDFWCTTTAQSLFLSQADILWDTGSSLHAISITDIQKAVAIRIQIYQSFIVPLRIEFHLLAEIPHVAVQCRHPKMPKPVDFEIHGLLDNATLHISAV